MGRIGKKQANVRPVSNQMDRYGRVLFNKNRELSQASLDVDKEGSISVKFDDQQDQEEEKKAVDVQSSKKEPRLRSV